MGAAVVCSFVAAVLLQRWQVNEDGFEGLMMLVAAVLVVTMIIWMNRIARSLKKEIEQRVEGYASRTTRAAGIGIADFCFYDGTARGGGAGFDFAGGGAF